MSTNEEIFLEEDFDSDDAIDFGEIGTVRPTLREISDDDSVQSVTPVYVDEVEATSSGNSEEHQDMCGNSKYEKISDGRWRVTMNGVITQSQLHELDLMRPADKEVKLISNLPIRLVEFDRFTVTQSDDLNYGTFMIDGEVITEPLFKFQLQTQDNEEEE